MSKLNVVFFLHLFFLTSVRAADWEVSCKNGIENNYGVSSNINREIDTTFSSLNVNPINNSFSIITFMHGKFNEEIHRSQEKAQVKVNGNKVMSEVSYSDGGDATRITLKINESDEYYPMNYFYNGSTVILVQYSGAIFAFSIEGFNDAMKEFKSVCLLNE
ncbi:hypothetical protein [Yersinia ruckeri]|uniref:hypothetical protein n=2 Tax=Yersinia ruckeri TaxID=29486 RepID=UPI00119DB61E|nr:hypothetical protein [Yersinia ruckeri]MCW6563907.1 hypothetical protein [Yersinia ruckeri]MCW6573583.1 hypothetical protein [Yersinia ruckeri]MCW6613695.1 hypothetical protein [Yersinia ruckeri]UZX67209.1 hypothetical protein ND437_09375 [Yersinia ruckeri]